MEDERMDNWRQFQGTELGAVMMSLYGNQNRPKINYPKPKTSKSKTLALGETIFRPCGNNPDAEDPRKTTRKKVHVAVPRPTSGSRYNSNGVSTDIQLPIQGLCKRKSEESIKSELEEIRTQQAHYRPAYVQPISSDAEKERLNQIFTCKGGKALPKELIAPATETPLEITAKLKESERMDAVRVKRGLKPLNNKTVMRQLSPSEMLADQITKEITERTQYVEEMSKIGALSAHDEMKMKGEIISRVNELKKLEATI